MLQNATMIIDYVSVVDYKGAVEHSWTPQCVIYRSTNCIMKEKITITIST
jgi:hypothetical protein